MGSTAEKRDQAGEAAPKALLDFCGVGATVGRTKEPVSLINGIPSALIQKAPEKPAVTPIRRASYQPSIALEIFLTVGHRRLEIWTASEVKWE